MKRAVLTLIFCCVLALSAALAQDKYFTKTGQVSFYSKTPMEDIAAHNNNANSVIDTKTGKMEFAVLMKAFKFKKALMEDDFNNNYLQTSQYPKANFAGSITDLSAVDFTKNGTYKVNVKGSMTIHGVTKEIETPGTITVQSGSVKANSVFYLVPEDYNISIPSVARQKVAKQFRVTVDMDYKPLGK